LQIRTVAGPSSAVQCVSVVGGTFATRTFFNPFDPLVGHLMAQDFPNYIVPRDALLGGASA
jgi:hypothetical protein